MIVHFSCRDAIYRVRTSYNASYICVPDYQLKFMRAPFYTGSLDAGGIETDAGGIEPDAINRVPTINGAFKRTARRGCFKFKNYVKCIFLNRNTRRTYGVQRENQL